MGPSRDTTRVGFVFSKVGVLGLFSKVGVSVLFSKVFHRAAMMRGGGRRKAVDPISINHRRGWFLNAIRFEYDERRQPLQHVAG